jgi:predicted aldo/keto reductase-like oxidoreductase
MTKAHLGDAKSVQRQLEDSLRNLKTDHLDLWQMHQVMDPEDVESRVEKGVLDVFVNAKQSGKTRYIGFTGHRTPASHQRVLELTDIFDTCQMPINVADPSYGSFIYGVLPTLVERKIGVLAMKTLACGGFFGGSDFGEHGNKPKVVPDRVSMAEAIHFVWSLPVSTLITGPDNGEQLVEKINLAHSFAGMDEGQRQSLVAKVVDLAVRGAEFYKAPDLSVSDWTLY